MAGSCDGGSAEGAFQFAQSGIPLDTCMQYEADDLACTPINTCRTCVGPPVRKTTKQTKNAKQRSVTECNGQPPSWHFDQPFAAHTPRFSISPPFSPSPVPSVRPLDFVPPQGSGTCFAQTNFTKIYVDQYRSVSGAAGRTRGVGTAARLEWKRNSARGVAQGVALGLQG